MAPTTGHKLTRYFQEQKALIKQFAKDHEIELTETACTLILSDGNKSIEMKPKIGEYRDMNTNLSFEYFNAIACLMSFFNCYEQH